MDSFKKHTIRDRHGYGNTRGVLETGRAGTGTVCKMPTRGYTATITAVSRVCTGIRSKILILFYLLILQFYLQHKGKKSQLCERLYMFLVCAQTTCYCLVWPATLWPATLSYHPLSESHCHHHSRCRCCHYSHCLTVTALALSLFHCHRSRALAVSLSLFTALAVSLSPLSLSRCLALVVTSPTAALQQARTAATSPTANA